MVEVVSNTLPGFRKTMNDLRVEINQSLPDTDARVVTTMAAIEALGDIKPRLAEMTENETERLLTIIEIEKRKVLLRRTLRELERK